MHGVLDVTVACCLICTLTCSHLLIVLLSGESILSFENPLEGTGQLLPVEVHANSDWEHDSFCLRMALNIILGDIILAYTDVWHKT